MEKKRKFKQQQLSMTIPHLIEKRIVYMIYAMDNVLKQSIGDLLNIAVVCKRWFGYSREYYSRFYGVLEMVNFTKQVARLKNEYSILARIEIFNTSMRDERVDTNTALEILNDIRQVTVRLDSSPWYRSDKSTEMVKRVLTKNVDTIRSIGFTQITTDHLHSVHDVLCDAADDNIQLEELQWSFPPTMELQDAFGRVVEVIGFSAKTLTTIKLEMAGAKRELYNTLFSIDMPALTRLSVHLGLVGDEQGSFELPLHLLHKYSLTRLSLTDGRRRFLDDYSVANQEYIEFLKTTTVYSLQTHLLHAIELQALSGNNNVREWELIVFRTLSEPEANIFPLNVPLTIESLSLHVYVDNLPQLIKTSNLDPFPILTTLVLQIQPNLINNTNSFLFYLPNLYSLSLYSLTGFNVFDSPQLFHSLTKNNRKLATLDIQGSTIISSNIPLIQSFLSDHPTIDRLIVRHYSIRFAVVQGCKKHNSTLIFSKDSVNNNQLISLSFPPHYYPHNQQTLQPIPNYTDPTTNNRSLFTNCIIM